MSCLAHHVKNASTHWCHLIIISTGILILAWVFYGWIMHRISNILLYAKGMCVISNILSGIKGDWIWWHCLNNIEVSVALYLDISAWSLVLYLMRTMMTTVRTTMITASITAITLVDTTAPMWSAATFKSLVFKWSFSLCQNQASPSVDIKNVWGMGMRLPNSYCSCNIISLLAEDWFLFVSHPFHCWFHCWQMCRLLQET